MLSGAAFLEYVKKSLNVNKNKNKSRQNMTLKSKYYSITDINLYKQRFNWVWAEKNCFNLTVGNGLIRCDRARAAY
jgi:hypothetical protein